MDFKNAAISVTNEPTSEVEILNEIGILQNVIDQFLSEAATEVQKEKLIKNLKRFATTTFSEQVYDYISVEDNGYYFYEEDVNHEKKAFFVPVDHSESNMETFIDAGTAGSQVTFYAWYNNNMKIRMKIDGKAICGDLGCSSSADKPLTTIIVSNTNYNIQPSSFQKWKLLSVVTGDDDGKNKSEFTNIKVDGVAVPSSAFPAPDQDYATVTRDASNNVIIAVTGM
ncbi:YrpD family protein [Paenibacillus sp. FSL R5-0912]|uniref:YrpD family protein n=1 Tax=Paenibacillus sp. FSL R5-0912 TaxID=1536771 RepID=UPI0004F7A3AC|nr:YrpD family protein [Paenibacillus sp. FSL R5-0912]AIQ44146.1 hypothetical protein R50912_32270 [Paenibacillus sp. FSL R5-0912]